MLCCKYVFVQVINDNFGIAEGLMTTVHAITGKHLLVLSSLQLHLCLTNVWHIFFLQPLKRLSMVHQWRTGEVVGLLPSTSFRAVLELLRYQIDLPVLSRDGLLLLLLQSIVGTVLVRKTMAITFVIPVATANTNPFPSILGCWQGFTGT